MIRRTLPAALLCCAAGLAGQTPVIRPAAAPVTAIGVLEGKPELELVGVTGVRRLPDGRVLVANGKPLELRLFDAKGAFIRRFGRTGGGPGEFRSAIEIATVSNTEIAIRDYGNRRLLRFAIDGALLDERPLQPQESRSAGFALLGSTLLVDLAPAWHACAKAATAALPPAGKDAFREGRFDAAGRFWWRAAGAPTWTVSTAEGRALATVPLPDRFVLYEVGSDMVVGKTFDEDDIERIVVLRVPIPAASKALPACSTRPDTIRVDGPATAPLKTNLRNTMTAQEAYFSDKASYAPDAATLTSALQLTFSTGTRLAILRGGKSSYAMASTTNDGAHRCLVSMGNAIPGWPDGMIVCGN